MYRITYKLQMITNKTFKEVTGEYETSNGFEMIMHYINTLRSMGTILELNFKKI